MHYFLIKMYLIFCSSAGFMQHKAIIEGLGLIVWQAYRHIWISSLTASHPSPMFHLFFFWDAQASDELMSRKWYFIHHPSLLFSKHLLRQTDILICWIHSLPSGWNSTSEVFKRKQSTLKPNLLCFAYLQNMHVLSNLMYDLVLLLSCIPLHCALSLFRIVSCSRHAFLSLYLLRHIRHFWTL